ncbi:MAG: NifB/NifX family molybdenum-iron cluster-binding protein [Myxococcota bacterium]
MIIAITATGNSLDEQVDPRFGRAKYICIHDTENGTNKFVDTGDIASLPGGAGPKMAQKIIGEGTGVLITGNGPGNNAHGVITRAGIKVYAGAQNYTIKDALAAFENGELEEF